MKEIPLMIATMNEDSEMILTLLEGGAFVDYRLGIKQNYLSALHLAAANSKISSLKVRNFPPYTQKHLIQGALSP